MVSIASITSTITGIVGAAKEVASVAKRVGNRELIEKVTDLQERILDIQTEMIDLTNENHNLKQRVSELEQVGELAGKLVYQESVYWLPKEGGRDGPFCPSCWDADRKLIRLTPGATKGTFSCGVGKHGGFRTAEYERPRSVAIARRSPWT
jgi:uncharacterized protein YydD (DUF2326 family)